MLLNGCMHDGRFQELIAPPPSTLLGKHRMIASGFPTVTKEKVGQGLC
jgi:hypothetical protein